MRVPRALRAWLMGWSLAGACLLLALAAVVGFTSLRGSTYPEVAFTASDGSTVTITGSFSFRQYARGESVEIAYRPAHPQEALIIRPFWQDIFWIPLTIIGWIGVVCLRRGWRARAAP